MVQKSKDTGPAAGVERAIQPISVPIAIFFQKANRSDQKRLATAWRQASHDNDLINVRVG
jgi:hypothetical protein